MAQKPKTFFPGASLVWRRQGILWWIFVVTLSFSFFATRSMAGRAAQALNHSLAADRLVHGFDLSAFLELGAQPEAYIAGTPSPETLWFPVVFTIFMLFITGGILTEYYRDERLHTGEFFESSGYHFWRFFRLMIFLVIVLIPVGILAAIAGRIYNRIDEKSISPFPAVWFLAGVVVVLLLILMTIRLWFDMAQVIAVAQNEKRMRRALRESAALVAHNFGSLFWLYFRVSLITWIGFLIALQIWKNRLPPETTVAQFLLSQAMILFWIGCRLWQRASEVLWYQQHLALETSPEPVAEPVPVMPVGAASPLTGPITHS
jgi:hypothetical protein